MKLPDKKAGRDRLTALQKAISRCISVFKMATTKAALAVPDGEGRQMLCTSVLPKTMKSHYLHNIICKTYNNPTEIHSALPEVSGSCGFFSAWHAFFHSLLLQSPHKIHGQGHHPHHNT